MNIGTRSILFGVHQFIWHPITVARAWRYLYGRWPRAWEWVCIFCHDLGYWGKPNMDGEEGRTHPEAGAQIAKKIVGWFAKFVDPGFRAGWGQSAWMMCIGHSTHYAEKHWTPISKLYLADKVSILFDPRWFYLRRARLTGEIFEYVQNSPYRLEFDPEDCTQHEIRRAERLWFKWYLEKNRFKAFEYFINKHVHQVMARVEAEWMLTL